MTPAEIRAGLENGTLSQEEAMRAFQAHRESRPQQAMQVRQESPRRMPIPGDRISHVEIEDRAALAAVRADLAREIMQRDAEHFYQRSYVEESARHAVGLFAYGIIGFADGIADSIGYGISELVEDVTFTIARTGRKAIDGFQRGWNG